MLGQSGFRFSKFDEYRSPCTDIAGTVNPDQIMTPTTDTKDFLDILIHQNLACPPSIFAAAHAVASLSR